MKILIIILVAVMPHAGWLTLSSAATPEAVLYRYESIEQRLAYLVPDEGRPILIPEDWLPTEAQTGDWLSVERVLEQGTAVTTFAARIELRR